MIHKDKLRRTDTQGQWKQLHTWGSFLECQIIFVQGTRSLYCFHEESNCLFSGKKSSKTNYSCGVSSPQGGCYTHKEGFPYGLVYINTAFVYPALSNNFWTLDVFRWLETSELLRDHRQFKIEINFHCFWSITYSPNPDKFVVGYIDRRCID